MNITALPEFRNHRSVLFLQDDKVHLRAFVAIHCGGIEKPAFGATRFAAYASEEEALRDALRLAECMSYKSAMAGLPYGGAKAVIMMTPEAAADRGAVFARYAQSLNYLGGSFVTGTDVGMTREDLAVMKRETSSIVGFRANPEYLTGFSVFCAVRAALREVFGGEDIAGRKIAIQGLGKTGFELLKLVVPLGARVTVADISKERVAEAERMFPSIEVMEPSAIHRAEVDVYAPCAMHGSINARTVPELRCAIVAGSANNQLESSEDGDRLHAAGILYVPDYISNAGGLIGVTDEYEHEIYDPVRVEAKIENVKTILGEVFAKSRSSGRGPGAVADELAREICLTRI